jgi:Taurine catabolism dioxygenase TauD, TfdA family
MAQDHRLIPERSAWSSAAIGGKAGLVYKLSDEHEQALRDLLERTRSLPCEDVTRELFDDPRINDFLGSVREELATGRGGVILQSLSKDRYSDEELTRLFWGIGTHLGVAVAQNTAGDRIDHVRDSADNPLGRRQYGTQELVLHTDNATGETLGLLCLCKGKSGGVSRVASALAVHNAFVRNRPGLLDALYKGYPYHRKGRQRPGDPLVTPFDVPIFSNIDGFVSVRYNRDYMEKAAASLGVEMPATLEAALDYFDEVSNREDVVLRFMLEPGEIMLINNLTCLHARTEFEDHAEPERKRHLVRLWINVPGGRPFPKEMDIFHDAADRADREPALHG